LLFFFVLSAFSHAQTSCSVVALSFDLVHHGSSSTHIKLREQKAPAL
jgi:hypothetical protein